MLDERLLEHLLRQSGEFWTIDNSLAEIATRELRIQRMCNEDSHGCGYE
jgi:hypothetical protein